MSHFSTVAVTLNFISMINNGFALSISTIISILLIKSLIYNNDLSLLLLTNCYIGIFSSSLVLLINCIYILKGDYQIYLGEETLTCRILGYILYVLLSATINAFAVQVCLFLLLTNQIGKKSKFVGSISFFLYFLSKKSFVTKTNNIFDFNIDFLDSFFYSYASCTSMV